MNGEQNNGRNFNSSRASGIGLTIIGGLALAFATFFIKDPAEESSRNADNLAAIRSELRTDLDRVRTENNELRKENGSLAGKITALESRVTSRLGPEGFSNKDATAKTNERTEIVKRIDGDVLANSKRIDTLDARVRYLERKK